MINNKRNALWYIPKNEFQTLIDSSNSISDVLRKLGMNPNNGSRKTLMDRIKKDNFDLTKIRENRLLCKKQIRKNKIPIEEVMTENSCYPRASLKKRIIKEKIFEYKCDICGIDNWQEKKISLQIDHINGNAKDNRKENLRLLCPNCHSQTSTYAGKNKPKKQVPDIFCICCGIKTSISNKCIRCSNKDTSWKRKFEISKEELTSLVKQMSFVSIGKKLGVSDNSVRKRCIALGVDIPKRNKSPVNKILADSINGNATVSKTVVS